MNALPTTAPSPETRVLLVEDHALLREGLRLLLQGQPGLIVVGEAGDSEAAVSLAACYQPDIILLDLQLGDTNSTEFLPELLAAAAQARVMLLTASGTPQDYRRALALGAKGIVLKEQASAVLLKAIKRVLSGEVWIDPTVASRIFIDRPASEAPPVVGSQEVDSETEQEAAKITSLTEREREVVSLVLNGLSNQEIAARLFLSERTVRYHLTSVFEKLGVKDRSRLLIYAHRHGLR